MLGTIVNIVTVLIGGSAGLLMKKGIPERITEQVMKAVGLCTIYLGITGAVGESLSLVSTVLLILSMAIGTLLGAAGKLDDKLNRAGEALENKVKSDGTTSIAEGFVNASLVFCVGSMTILGALQSGTQGDHTLLFTKSVLDMITAAILASTLGVGVLFSVVFILIYQGGLTLLAQIVMQYSLLADETIVLMNCAGSLILIALGLNMIGIGKFKLMNFVPAIFVPIVLYPLSELILQLF